MQGIADGDVTKNPYATPPDRSVEEMAGEIHGAFASAYAIGEKVSHEWLKNKLTFLYHQGIEAGRRERDTQVQDVVRALDECIECCELVNGTDYCKNCGLEKEMYATLKHPNEPV